MPTCADHFITVDSTKRTAPKWSFGGRPNTASASLTPGPGHYNSDKKGGSPSWGFSTGTRKNMGRSFAPGPGAYDIKSTIGTGTAYSMRKRPQTAASGGNNTIGSTYTQFGY